MNEDWTASNMLDPKVSESLQFLYDLIHVDKVSPIPGKNTMDNQFHAGQVAMISRGHWIVENAMAAKLDLDIAIPPTRVNDYTVIGFGGYGISKTSKYPDLAKELVGELTSSKRKRKKAKAAAASRGGNRPPRPRPSSPIRQVRRFTIRPCRIPFRYRRRPISKRSRRSSSAITLR